MNLTDIVNANQYQSAFETCPGCDNHCTVRKFTFANGNVYFSGNNCEKIYTNHSEVLHKGTNMFTEKYRLLFQRKSNNSGPVIGMPRALGIYENYPFWHTLFTACGCKVELSGTSSNQMYQTGLRSIMADNICFPAKLMHGHINDLISRRVERIFYPWVVYERKEDPQAQNSFNCPIVSGYSDVIKSSMNPLAKHHIPVDAPVIAFNDEHMLQKACVSYLATLGIKKNKAIQAVQQAIHAQNEYLLTLTRRAEEILNRAREDNRMVILLAARPYHTDPLIEHKISQSIADMGIDVITEHVASMTGTPVYDELNAVSQWAYPNRIFKAAYFAGNYPHPHLQMVELTSFGCGPDAFILDEVNAILQRYGKNLTTLKIDDVNNIGSLRLRIRSMVESCKENFISSAPAKPYITTKTFEAEDRKRTIIAPYFAEGYSEFVASVFKCMGYHVVCLPTGNQQAAETGLKYANNDICYPATIVVGSIMNALQSGKYDLQNTAVIITQTGGQCRASNYYALIKNAMVSAGYSNIPVISLATGTGINACQPGFTVNWKHMAGVIIHTMLYADCINKLYHAALVRETEQGIAASLRDKYTRAALPFIEANRGKQLLPLIKQAAKEFALHTRTDKKIPVIGVVGEIYVKYNGFSNKYVSRWLMDHGVEVVPPSIINFFSTSFVNNHINRKLHIKQEHTPVIITDAFYAYLRSVMRTYDRACQAFPFYRKFTDIFTDARLAERIINMAADFGEGWDLPGEICNLAEHGIHNVVSLQPFGCIANHIISKGVEKRIKQVYPHMNLLFLDFDSSTSEANVFNRLHFMIENCKKQL